MRRLAILAALSLASLALGANPKASALAKDADRLYKDNKYKEAAETLRQAYEADPLGLYLYNIARAYDQAGELELSQEYYRKYVALPSEESQPDLVKKANLAMDRLRTLVAKDEAGRQLNDAEKKRLEDEARVAKETAATEAEKARLQKESYEAKERAALEAAKGKTSARLVAGVVVGGLAVAGLGSGIAFGVLSGSSKSSFTSATTVADKKKFETETKTRALIADVSFAGAAAFAIAAIIVFPKGSAEPPKAVEVVFAPAPGGGYAGLQGSF